jgi:hypothetical protein
MRGAAGLLQPSSPEGWVTPSWLGMPHSCDLPGHRLCRFPPPRIPFLTMQADLSRHSPGRRGIVPASHRLPARPSGGLASGY